MSTENRSSNTDMISAPRELLNTAVNGYAQEQGHALNGLREILAQPAEQHQGGLAIPDECPHLIVFDDAEVGSLMFSGAGARTAALKKWEAISTSWNAHLFVRVARNSRDDGHLCATVADPGEVERLRVENEQLREVIKHSDSNIQRQSLRISNQRPQLDERDALLHDIEKRHWSGVDFDLPADLVVKIKALSAGAEPSAPAVSIPEGYCIMPRRLTAENGAKALLLGEFKLEVICECPECLELEEPAEGCEICDGEGEYGQRHTIPWDQIKFIYSEAVKGLALQSPAVLARKS